MQALSATDSAFLWLETRQQPMHVAGLNLYVPPAGGAQAFIQNLLAHWGQSARAKAPFLWRPVLRMGLWYWEEDTEFELDYHLRHVALPQPAGMDELLALVSREHGHLLDRNRPLWEVWVIEGLPDGRVAVYTKIHHALMDGVTGAKLLVKSLSPQPQERRPPVWGIGLDTGRTAAAPPGRTSVGAQWAQALQSGRQIMPGITGGLLDIVRSFRLDRSDGSQGAAADGKTVDAAEEQRFHDLQAALPFQAPPSLFNVEISGSRRFAVQSYALRRFKRIAEAAGATVNDVVLAVCAGGLRRYLQGQSALPRKPLIAMVPVSLHDEHTAAGNQVSLILASLGTHLADPVKRLAHIARSTSQAKKRFASMPRLQKWAHGVASISPMAAGMVTGSAQRYPLFNVVISNVPGPTDPLYLHGAALDAMYPASIVTHYLALNITVSGYADQLGFGFVACRRSVPALQSMVTDCDASLAELETSLGLTAKNRPRRTPKNGERQHPLKPR